jgi:hypothetical protein
MGKDEDKDLLVDEGVDTEETDDQPGEGEAPQAGSAPGPFDNATDDNGSLLASGQAEQPPQPGQQTSVGEG